MQRVGVEAVVEGLSGFQSGMGKIDSLIKNLIPGADKVFGAFESLGNIFKSVASFAGNVLAHALGELLADAVQWVTKTIMELIDSAIEIGDQFQSLRIRLNQMNFNTAIDGGMEYARAMEFASAATEEQLMWIQKLAFATPFELADITQVYSMARSYGFADTEARGLVETLTDFTAGMGLGGDAIVSIIRQFGQMQNTGKILQKDLNSLAEGGMVPVNKILDIMKEKTGLTGKAFEDFQHSMGGVNMFMETFTEYVGKNFVGAATRANRTLKNATITLKEFFSTLLGSRVIAPIFDVLGELIAKINDALSARLPDITHQFDRIGKVVSEIITTVAGLAPSADALADGFVSALNSIATWLEQNQDGIVAFFKSAIEKASEFRDFLLGIPSNVTTTVTTIGGNEISTSAPQSGQQGFLDKMLQTLRDMQPLVQPIKHLLASIMEVAGAALGLKFGDLSKKSFAENVKLVAEQIEKLATWISENKDEIAEWVVKIGEAIAMAWALSVAIGVVWETLKIISFMAWATSAVAAINFVIGWFALLWQQLQSLYESFKSYFVNSWNDFWSNLSVTITQVIADISNGDWAKAGEDVLKGIGRGLKNQWENIKTLVSDIAKSFIERFKYLFGISSPSTVMEQMGKDLLDGLINGMNAKIGEVVAVFTSLKDRIIAKLKEMVANAISVFRTFVDNTKQKFEEMRTSVVSKINEIKTAVIAKFEEIKNSVLSVASTLKNSVVAKFNEIRVAVVQKITDLKNGVSTKFTALASFMITKLKSILNGFDYANFVTAGKTIMDKIISGVTNGTDALYNAIKAAVESAWAAVSAALSTVTTGADAAPTIADALLGPISGVASALDKTVEQIIMTVKAQFMKGDAFSSFGSALTSRFESRITTPLTEAVERFQEKIEGVDQQLENLGLPLSEAERNDLLREQINLVNTVAEQQWKLVDVETELAKLNKDIEEGATEELIRQKTSLIYDQTQAQWKLVDVQTKLASIESQIAAGATGDSLAELIKQKTSLIYDQTQAQWKLADVQTALVNIENEMAAGATDEQIRLRTKLIHDQTQAQWNLEDAQSALVTNEALLNNNNTEEQRNALLQVRADLLAKQAIRQDELNAANEKALVLQKQQENLSFLKAQMDLINFIREMGIAPSAVLGNFKLGLDADVEGLMVVMSNALKGINVNISKTLAETDWDKELPSLADAANVGESIGTSLASGIAEGITSGTNQIYSALLTATGGMSGPSYTPPVYAMASAPQRTISNTSNYNLSINTTAQSEPIIADFAMMASLGG